MTNKNNDLLELIKGLNINKSNIINYTDTKDPVVNNQEILGEDDGYVEVRDHQIFVINPSNNGKQPVLIPNSKLQIYVNGSLLKKEQVVFDDDDIRWNVKPTNDYGISISKDNLQVSLQVYPDLFIGYRLKDQKRARRIMIDIEPVEKYFDVEEIISQIAENIVKKGIRVEINTSAIMQEILDPKFKEILVAEGLPVIPSKDGYIQQYFSSVISEVLEEVSGMVDFKNRVKIPTVEAGEVIAQIFSPREGKAGHNVYGDSLEPKTPKEVIVRPKPRVKISDDGKVIALLSGRPSVTGSSVKQFDILDTYEINGDVDMKTGNIFFNGDVIVRGNIKDGMRIDCSGSLFVFGNVYHSTLTASQNVYVTGNIIGSKVNGGQFGMYYSSVYKIAQDLSVSLKRLQYAYSQLKVALSVKNTEYKIGYIVATLVETKFKEITKNVNDFYQIINKMLENKFQFPIHLQIVMNSLKKLKDYQAIHSIDSEQSLQSIQFSINELIQKMEADIQEESDISFYSSNLSQIKTNGRIIVKKEGIINSTLFAGTEINFEKRDSVIRGGKVEAVKTINAGIVGSAKGKSPILYAGETINITEINQAQITMRNEIIFIDEKITNLELKYNEKTERIESNKRLPSY
ncbi:hypothetical protein BKP45_03140 [Anaerobacillus alkalidiazotrophicus]|uniref:Flagellar Assembly Protein A N-terminal region domain-containing protein n=1 Tax=Anaerobacillus alkalidiazotrophicus TaxID=472963 RepID=A0A1S2MAH7_9BACI|nr:FapA family protein [Anaerobacillus alkalidiazotrophicus]OIJ21709.1 hypothetical protein BKP45_03140 [Anaerobacillus alkalidiazotrophicus]